MQLEGKVAMIAGGIGGIGAETTKLFNEQGTRVLCTDIADGGEEFVSQFTAGVAFSRQDISEFDDWQRIIAHAEELFGPVSVLVNNAGIVGNLAAVQDVDDAESGA